MSFSIGSLFDGSGGFPLAGALCGIQARWASEVEPYPIAVTKSRFPKMKHLGDISKLNGAEIEPVDIITFGSPCQDLSVAGKQAGISEGTRSGLFIEAVRIIKEMSEATNGKYPTFALWENVPGAFSCNKGEDFRIVLEELIKIVEPDAVMPPVPKRGWAYADSYSGDGWSLAYRVLNAQYWGVPHRRRRIHLVLDLRGQRARKVLFERKNLRGHTPASRQARYRNTFGAQGCAYEENRQLSNFVREYNRNKPYQTSKLQPIDGVADTLCTSSAFAKTIIFDGKDYLFRRFSPTECARLQGFPDRWGDIEEKRQFTEEELSFWIEVRNTHASINGRKVRDYSEKQMLTWYNKLHNDSAEYKMWGNGIALPTALYCMQGMAEALNTEEVPTL